MLIEHLVICTSKDELTMFTEVFDILLAKILKPFEFEDEKKKEEKDK